MPQLADTEPSPRSGPAFPLLESKLHPPPARPTLVLRSALVERVAQASSVAVVTIVAPPGYGKTTLLTQLAEPVARRAAWLSLDDGDNDPEILLSYIAGALDRVEPIEPAVFRMVKRRGFSVASTAVLRLAAAMAAMAEPAVLVLDQVESLPQPGVPRRDRRARAAPARGSRQLVVASRGRAADAAGRGCEADGALLEIGVDDLAMDPAECACAPERRGRATSTNRDGRADRADRGLAGRPLPRRRSRYRAGGADAAAALSFSGDDRLSPTTSAPSSCRASRRTEVSFLTRTSVLDRMCGPLCDAVLGTTGSAEILRLARALEPAPRRARSPTASGTGTTTCSATCCAPSWVGANPSCRRSSTAAPRRGARRTACPRSRSSTPRQAGDGDRVAALVLRSCNRCGRAAGSTPSCAGWSGSRRAPDRALPGGRRARRADLRVDVGRAIDAERWAAAAERAPPDGMLADGSTMESYARVPPRRSCAATASTAMRRDATRRVRRPRRRRARTARRCSTPKGFATLHEGDLDARRPDLRPRADDAAIQAGSVAARGDDPGRARHRSRSHATTGPTPRTSPPCARRWSRDGRARRLLDERARVRGRRTRGARTVGDSTGRATTWRGPRVCGRCSRTPFRISRRRRCSSWPARTSALGDTAGARAVLAPGPRHRATAAGPRPAPPTGGRAPRPPRLAARRRAGASSLTTAELRLAASPPDAPHVPGDRRAAARVAPHGEDASHLDLPEARRVVAQRRDRQDAGARPPRSLNPH